MRLTQYIKKKEQERRNLLAEARRSADGKIPRSESSLDFKKCQGVGHLFHSCSLFRPSIMLLSGWLVRLYTSASQKKRGEKTFAKNTKLFSIAFPFFLPITGVGSKHAKPLSAMLECPRSTTKKGEVKTNAQ